MSKRGKAAAKPGRKRGGSARSPAERMRAYRARKRAAGLKRVSEWAPVQSTAVVYSDHRIREARSLALHCKTAQKIAARPELLEVARRNLERWAEGSEGRLPRYMREWQQILARPWPEIAAFMTSFSERAVRLRQSSPFAGILTPEERRRIYEAFRS